MSDIVIIFQYPSDKRVTLKTLTLDSKIDDVLNAAVNGWPEGLGDVPEVNRMRLICMGQILSEGGKTLGDYKIRVLANGTTVSVSVRPLGVKKNVEATLPTKQNNAQHVPVRGAPAPAAAPQARGCCTIS